MIRLISFIVVVFPQPDGPTKITISPSGISRDSASTAGSAWPGNCLVSLSRRILIRPASAVLIGLPLMSSAG